MVIKKITVNGAAFIGKLTKNEEEVTLNNAMSINPGTVTRDTFASYLELKNEGKLESIDFSGQGGLYGVSDLTDTEKLELKVCKMNMRHAKKVAAAGTENSVFRQLLGKQ